MFARRGIVEPVSTLQLAYFANGEDNVADDDELFIQVLLVVGVIYLFLRHIKAAGLEHPIFGPKWAMSQSLSDLAARHVNKVFNKQGHAQLSWAFGLTRAGRSFTCLCSFTCPHPFSCPASLVDMPLTNTSIPPHREAYRKNVNFWDAFYTCALLVDMPTPMFT